ncbi:unnamed protein product [Acanthosepion pharaonis]|uniref:Integrase catalytic domain-containing protein n=1 Tax=Acanthosepion pharaonis TaxID=158019 RepID=A0A812B3X0_ACAPH|nr:unnamed protein product [Sepia pharaonis]
MRQDRDEPVRRFGARQREQADICRFVITCPSCKYNVNYTDAFGRDILSRGIADSDIQLDLLGDKNQDVSLEEVFQFIKAKEAGKRSASRPLNTFSVEAARSSYQRTKYPLDEDKRGPCSYYGKRGHGTKSATRIRRNQCTAFGHKCERCHRDNHFGTMCSSKDTPNDRRPSQTERFNKGNAVFNSLCNAKDGSFCCEPVKLILTDDLALIASNHDAFRHSTQSLPDLRVYDTTDSDIKECVIAAATTSLNALNLKSVTWDRVRTATASDEDMLFRDDLSNIDGVIVYKDRIVIPPSLRDEVLCALHSAHQGVTSMIARAESSVFWPGITPAIAALRASCLQCNRNAPSIPSAPPVLSTSPEYPFQCLCADFFTYKGNHYLVIVDRYSNWPIVERSSDGTLGFISCLRRTFVTYSIPVELASDRGQFTATITRQFLADWGVHQRLSSVAFSHSNCRAKLGVKTVKRHLMDNTGPSGTSDTDSFQRAMLQYRNTPDRDTKLSPAMCIFGRPIRDFIPIIPGNYRPHETWRSTWKAREEALRNRHMRCAERLSEHIKRLQPLVVGDHVPIQNQVGPYARKWDKTGIVIEVRPIRDKR